jgi:hypothetical protein
MSSSFIKKYLNLVRNLLFVSNIKSISEPGHGNILNIVIYTNT